MVEVTRALWHLEDVCRILGLETDTAIEVENRVVALNTAVQFVTMFEGADKLINLL